ncbi:MAG: efflux RND transporter periplasmic adaptor subunit [Bacteroidales bacterium]|nr:efflux RND transporter periplasmic adaptor subunit [Bacteroidales bacterium]
MKKLFIAIGIVLLGVIAWFFLKKSPAPKQKIETASVERTDMSRLVTATGTLEPIINVEVGTQVSGIISKIYVDYNSNVKKGEILAELDRTTLESELASQTSAMKGAKVEYEYQEKNFARMKELHQKQMISDTEYETALYSFEKARNSYDKSKSDMVKSKTNLGYATIYSPIDGVVISRAVDEGQTVAASFSTPTLFTIANDLTKMQVIANVDEADIGEVEVGQNVSFEVDAFPNDVFQGEVTQVRLEATTTSNVVTYEVVINAPNPDLKLKPGLTANVTIMTLEKNNVLSVPSKALKYKADASSNEKAVWVLRNGIEEKVSVKTGYDDRINTEIIEGLKEGDKVITGSSLESTADNSPQGESSSPFMPTPPGKKK